MISINSRNLIITLFVIILLNFGFYTASLGLGINRPLVNIDYAVVLVSLAYLPFWVSFILILFFFVLDYLAIVSQILPFPRIEDVIYLLQFSLEASTFIIFLLLATVILLVFKLMLVFNLRKSIDKFSALALLNFCLLVSFAFAPKEGDAAYTKNYVTGGAGVMESISSNFFIMRSSAFLAAYQGSGQVLVEGSSGATGRWFDEINSGEEVVGKKFLLIVNESWGFPLNHEIQLKLLAPLKKVRSDIFEYGATDASGVTLDGELRELCKMVSRHYNFYKVNSGFEKCLPSLFKGLGYKTKAMHAATKLMYDRHYWYPLAGFDDSIFFEDKIGSSRCYSFPGACDLDLFDEVEKHFIGSKKAFFYWLTLNSHYPYDERDIKLNIFECGDFNIKENSEVCRNLKIQAQFFFNLSKTLSSPSMSGVEVIIVSDHVPVFLNVSDRKKFFNQSVVPWVYLKVKGQTS